MKLFMNVPHIKAMPRPQEVTGEQSQPIDFPEETPNYLPPIYWDPQTSFVYELQSRAESFEHVWVNLDGSVMANHSGMPPSLDREWHHLTKLHDARAMTV